MEKANAKELVETAVASSYSMSTGKLEAMKLANKLEDLGATVSSAEFPMIVTTPNGFTFEIDLGGKIISATGITLSVSRLKLLVGGEADIQAYIPDATDSNITWSSTDNNIVKVDENGHITVQEGATVGSSAQIIASSGIERASCSVVVVNSIEGITIDPITILEGRAGRITLPGTALEDVEYSTTSEIISVSGSGNIKGESIGTAEITIVGKASQATEIIQVKVVKSIMALMLSPISIEVGNTKSIRNR